MSISCLVLHIRPLHFEAPWIQTGRIDRHNLKAFGVVGKTDLQTDNFNTIKYNRISIVLV